MLQYFVSYQPWYQITRYLIINQLSFNSYLPGEIMFGLCINIKPTLINWFAPEMKMLDLIDIPYRNRGCQWDQAFFVTAHMNLDLCVSLPHHKITLCQIWPGWRLNKYQILSQHLGIVLFSNYILTLMKKFQILLSYNNIRSVIKKYQGQSFKFLKF